MPSAVKPTIAISEGEQLLEANTNALLDSPPPNREVRIMVTMSAEASTDYELVRDLVRNGMDVQPVW